MYPTRVQISFLKKYGYVSEQGEGEFAFTPKSFSEALTKVQAFAGLPQTGVMDYKTKKVITFSLASRGLACVMWYTFASCRNLTFIRHCAFCARYRPVELSPLSETNISINPTKEKKFGERRCCKNAVVILVCAIL